MKKLYKKYRITTKIKNGLLIAFLVAAVSLALFRPILYNNGVCLKCGGHYAIVHESFIDGTAYVNVECNNCGNEIYMLPKFFV